nr:MAG TPA: actin-related protein 3 [Bacteriophage sp.]
MLKFHKIRTILRENAFFRGYNYIDHRTRGPIDPVIAYFTVFTHF